MITVTYLSVPQLHPLIHPEIIGQNQFNYYMEFKAADIPAGLAVNTPYTLNFGTAYKYNRVNNVALIVQDPFWDTADATQISTLVDVGDAGTPTGYIAAAQVNKYAGALIKAAYKTGGITVPKDYAANTLLDIIFTPGATWSLSNLKRGSLIVLFDLFKFSPPIDTDSV
jgi:hypothetical protein